MHIPRPGFRSITPYLFAQGAANLIGFLQRAFDARILSQQTRPDGAIMHAELRIGDSMVMLGESSVDFGPTISSIYLYVDDSDSSYQRAISSGGTSVFPIETMPSGERYGGIKDPCGNIWWIASHVEDLSQEEQDRRWRDYRK